MGRVNRRNKLLGLSCKVENLNGRPKPTVYMSNEEVEDGLFCAGLQGNIFDVFLERKKEEDKLC